MLKRRISAAALIGALVVVAFLTGGWLERPEPAANDNVYQQARLFETVLEAIRRQYVDSMSEPDLYFRATTGIVDHLRDPYSALLVNDAYRRYEEDLAGSQGGLGLQLDLRAGLVTVASVAPGSPAERDGILPGDRIVSVDGRPTKGWNVGQAGEVLRGEPGTEITLVLQRPGEPAPATHQLFRRAVHRRAASAGVLLADSIGVITLDRITAVSARELEESVDSLQAEGMTRLVLDLRFNPGGVLNQAVALADLFLDRNAVIGTLRGRDSDQTTVYRASHGQAWPDLPVAVLVNGGTASSAEIIAGALQDQDRAIVVGTPSYGKGAVQSTIPLGEGLALKLTTARWYLPSGRSVQRAGQYPPEGGTRTAEDTLRDAARYFTRLGRPVTAHEGIAPDLLVQAAGQSQSERRFRRALGSELPHYYDLLTAFAQEQRAAGTVRDSSFTADPRLRAEFEQRLRREGVRIPEQALAAGRQVVNRDLEDAITEEVFGPTAAVSRRLARDPQLAAALRALRSAPTDGSLPAAVP